MEAPIHRHSAEPSKYRPRQPTQTLLYQIVAGHLETFLACTAEQQNSALPRYVQKELRRYLECGVFAHGFLRARCSDCGKDLLVALNAVARLFVEQITRFQRERAGAAGVKAPKTGAIVFPQRFGGSLNLNVHFHVAVPDGVYTVANNSGNETATANFHPLAQPTQRDLDEITHNVNARVCAWLKRKGFLQNESESECNDAEAQPLALDACLVASLGVGELVSVRSAEGQLPEDCPARPAKAARRPGSSNGFNLHAGVVIASDDRPGGERLLRYCARPLLAWKGSRCYPVAA